jgi:hypothetical protein
VKKVVVILLITEFVIALFVLAPTCILRREQRHAFAAWNYDPNPVTKAELDRQSRITELHRFGFSFIVLGLMAGATLGIARIWPKRIFPEETGDRARSV